MANTSSKVIDTSLYIQLQNEMAELLSEKPRDVVAENLFSLLGDEEAMMLSKRLGMIVMTIEGYSTYAIAAKLAVSDSTVRQLQKKYRAGRYDNLIPYIKKKSFDPVSMWPQKTRGTGGRKKKNKVTPKITAADRKAAVGQKPVTPPDPAPVESIPVEVEEKPKKKRWGLW